MSPRRQVILRVTTKDSVTAQLRWPPEMWPIVKASTKMVNPKDKAIPIWVAPTAVPCEANTSNKKTVKLPEAQHRCLSLSLARSHPRHNTYVLANEVDGIHGRSDCHKNEEETAQELGTGGSQEGLEGLLLDHNVPAKRNKTKRGLRLFFSVFLFAFLGGSISICAYWSLVEVSVSSAIFVVSRLLFSKYELGAFVRLCFQKTNYWQKSAAELDLFPVGNSRWKLVFCSLKVDWATSSWTGLCRFPLGPFEFEAKRREEKARIKRTHSSIIIIIS